MPLFYQFDGNSRMSKWYHGNRRRLHRGMEREILWEWGYQPANDGGLAGRNCDKYDNYARLDY